MPIFWKSLKTFKIKYYLNAMRIDKWSHVKYSHKTRKKIRGKKEMNTKYNRIWL